MNTILRSSGHWRTWDSGVEPGGLVPTFRPNSALCGLGSSSSCRPPISLLKIVDGSTLHKLKPRRASEYSVRFCPGDIAFRLIHAKADECGFFRRTRSPPKSLGCYCVRQLVDAMFPFLPSDTKCLSSIHPYSRQTRGRYVC